MGERDFELRNPLIGFAIDALLEVDARAIENFEIFVEDFEVMADFFDRGCGDD